MLHNAKPSNQDDCPVQLLPEIRHSWLIQEISDEAVATAVRAGIKQMCPRANAVTAEAVARATAAGLSVRCWGVKDVSVRPNVSVHGGSSAMHFCACVYTDVHLCFLFFRSDSTTDVWDLSLIHI